MAFARVVWAEQTAQSIRALRIAVFVRRGSQPPITMTYVALVSPQSSRTSAQSGLSARGEVLGFVAVGG